ncbi:type IA DNA topoisomerase [Lysinibacillus capsici]|uniref:type IA DNA topoisomerase n=1 Tax=Lysinibacillus capsici TaxID=2115968 RepID=UPI001CD9907C|nr:type IA DNA topoisomerase [Lysinibacillus capsici]
MNTVILAEKPSQAKAYAEAFEVAKREKTHIELKPCSTFPDGAVITWGIGHLVGLKMPGEYRKEWKNWDIKNLPIIPAQFEYKVSEDKKVQFNAVKKLINNADVVINACDIDREGSNIFYSTFNMTGAKNKTIKRLWINSLEVDEIVKGFQSLQSNEKDLLMYSEAKTRQISDWLVGMNASPLYSLLIQGKGLNTSLSVGRVQSPLVYMIYQHQKEIENFVSKPFFELVGHFKTVNGTYSGKAKVKTDTLEELTSLLLGHSLALEEENEGVVLDLDKKEKRTKSPKLHSLSTLQEVANKKWEYSPANVLKIMQSLYEKKICTYPRTDTNFITENEFLYLSNNVEQYMKLINVDFSPNKEANKRYVDGSKVQEHYAIIPTKTIPNESTINALTAEEKNIYDEVLRNTLAMFHNDYIYEEMKIVTAVHDIEFETVGKIELNKGWKSLFMQSSNDENNKIEADKVLPRVSKNGKVISVLQSKEGRTTAPKPYTEGDLVKVMKNAGKTVDDESDKEILNKVEGLGTEATRSSIIETIKKNGYITVTKNIVSVTNKAKILCEAIEGTLLASPVMTAKWEGKLKEIGTGNSSPENFISNIKAFIMNLIQEAPKKIGQVSNIEQTIKIEQANNNKGNCPCCKKGQMIDRKTFYGCSEYRNGCKFSINKIIATKKLTEKNINDLLNKGIASVIKGFKSKADKLFDAKLKVTGDKVTFEFK